MAIDFESALKVLSESNGNTFFDVEIPTTKQKVQMSFLSVGMKKSIAKLAMSNDDKDYIQFKMAQLAMIKALDIKQVIKTEELKEIDFLSIVSQIVDSNTISPIALNVPCNKSGCDGITSMKIDFASIIKNIADGVDKKEFNKSYSKEINGNTISFELGLPVIADSIVLESLKNDGMTDIEYDMLFPYLFINKALLNGQEIGFKTEAESTLMGRIAFVETLPSSIVSGEDALPTFIQETFKEYGALIQKASQTVKCSKCGKDIHGVVNADSFFLL